MPFQLNEMAILLSNFLRPIFPNVNVILKVAIHNLKMNKI